jgi:hypothetical protein
MDLRQRPVSAVMRREVVTTTAREKLGSHAGHHELWAACVTCPCSTRSSAWSESSRTATSLAAAMTEVLDFDSKSRRTFLRSIEVG